MSLEAHPAAVFFPLLTGKQFASLTADISANGLRDAIVVYEGKILDGRNRYRACLELGITPRVTTYAGNDPFAFAWSVNGERRHLSISQRGAIAVEMMPGLKADAEKRRNQAAGQPQGTKSVPRVLEGQTGEVAEIAAKIVGVSSNTVYNAARVKKENPELFEKIHAGEVSAEQAYQAVTGKKKVAAKVIGSRSNRVRVAQVKELARQGYGREQIAQELGLSADYVSGLATQARVKLYRGSVVRLDSTRVIEAVVSGLEGLASDLDALTLTHVIPKAAHEWARLMVKPLRAFHKLKRRLQEKGHGEKTNAA